MNTLINLLNYGQSYWLDNLTRKKIKSGELQKRVTEQGLRGITSNPSIFNKAISNSADYDEQIKSLIAQQKSVQQIYEALTISDVQDACDILKPVFDSSGGTDGFVSLEVSPYLARDTQATMAEARRLYKEVGKANCLIKIPGTKEGLVAIEQMLYEGININITLLFSVQRYEEVAHAYIKALQRRVAENKPISNIVSVASFFLSRIDTLTDQLLNHHYSSSNIGRIAPALLSGKAGIVSARLAYQSFKQIFGSNEWMTLEAKGAHVQRPLWASTSNKDPLYSDVRYVETLIGPDTVNTLPDETIAAFADHGKLVANSIEDDLNDARLLFDKLKVPGIDINFITEQLEQDGIQKFIDAYNKLIENLAAKRLKMPGTTVPQQEMNAGALNDDLQAMLKSLDEKQVSRRLFDKDAHLWKTDEEEVAAIHNRLGWITLPGTYNKKVDEFVAFAGEIKNEGYKYAVLLGMGGSSLCSEVARQTYGKIEGYPELLVLDNTAPEAVLDIGKQIDLEKTIFIVASKSGTTTEPNCFFQYFYGEVEKKLPASAGKNFVAITDEGTPLVKVGEEHGFRKVFINPGDLGGRYSVLSDFGFLPMALAGMNAYAILASAQSAELINGRDVPAVVNPAISLGALLGLAQKRGRDKVTFVLSESIKSFGLWTEQLIAESTGKEGKGLIPIQGEELGSPEDYGNDRVFAFIRVTGDDNKNDERKLKALEKAGHPVVRIQLNNILDLGGEFYRWEIATAIAVMIIGINAFNEPNVAESKNNTKQLLSEYAAGGSFKIVAPLLKDGKMAVYGESSDNTPLSQNAEISSFVRSFALQARPGDYIALLPYFLETPERTKTLQAWRNKIRDELQVATTLLYGPRYLHSTGQLHKGGPGTGLYIMLIGEDKEKVEIPNEQYDFSTLHEAQVLGDYRSLNDHHRRVIRIYVGKNIDAGLKKIFRPAKKAGESTVKHEPHEV